MDITRLSSQGQVTIPPLLRKKYHWEVGQELIMVHTSEGILLKAKQTFPETTLNEVAGCLHYQQKAKTKTIDEMEQSIGEGITKNDFYDCH